jgi:hypothetical protein
MKFLSGLPAIQTEIYLPAKFTISGDLIQSLDNALNPKRIQEHFENVTCQTGIKDGLPPRLRSSYDGLKDKLIKNSRAFGGYSLYDLKGCWTEAATQQIVRDANTCIRIVDWPMIPQFVSDNDLSQRLVRTVFALRLHHERRPDFPSVLGVNQESDLNVIPLICDALDDWIDQSSLLLYGFLMYRLAEIAGAEVEIFMTSQFVVVNQLVRSPNRGE